jgi:hypothetical protein
VFSNGTTKNPTINGQQVSVVDRRDPLEAQRMPPSGSRRFFGRSDHYAPSSPT